MDQEYHNFYAGVASMLLNPIQTLESIGQQKMDTYDKEGLSYAITEIGTEVLSEILLAKGLGQLSKLSKVLNVTEDVADYANVVDELVEGGSKTIDDIIDNLPETTNGKGVARNFESTGGFEQTIKDFDALDPTDVKEIQTQYGPEKVGKLSDGTTVVARPGSTTGGATLEIRVSNSKVYKIRY